MKQTIIPVLILLILSCSEKSKVTVSHNSLELKKYINLEKYTPVNSEWTYSKMGSQSESRVLGPNDFKLNAVLYFQPVTIELIKNDYNLLSFSLETYQKSSFKFDWLSMVVKKEIEKGNYVFYNSSFFEKGTLAHGGFIILNDSTILLTLSTI
jgi:hypothetical protein